MIFVVHTQYMENYGAHSESGRFAKNNHYWKFKFGSTYIVEGLDREQDAMAFVATIAMTNDCSQKEWPCHCQPYQEWESEFSGDADYWKFLQETAKRVNPKDYDGYAF